MKALIFVWTVKDIGALVILGIIAIVILATVISQYIRKIFKRKNQNP